jgi:hypothetical protein
MSNASTPLTAAPVAFKDSRARTAANTTATKTARPVSVIEDCLKREVVYVLEDRLGGASEEIRVLIHNARRQLTESAKSEQLIDSRMLEEMQDRSPDGQPVVPRADVSRSP